MPRSPLQHIQQKLAASGAYAVLLTALPDIRWACGFTGSNGLLLVTAESAHFVTDGRYATQAPQEVRGAEVHVPGYALYAHLADAELVPDGATVIVQADALTLADAERLRAALPEVTWRPETTWMAPLVARKTDDEVKRLRAAQAVTDAVFEELVDWLRPGLTERAVAAEIVHRHLQRGAERMAFDPIVAAGPHGALPHARPSSRTLQEGDLVVLDFGCVLDGYASDMTRTVAIGEPGDEARQVYEVVRRAQQAALDAARAEMRASELDAVARSVIEEAGYGEAFNHSLGHGIGLRTHEWPSVSYRNEEPLPLGAAVTIEPGIYLADRFGVRIEDIIVLREDGAENLTRSDKALLTIGA